MSMLDSFFSRGFRGTKCKTALKLTIPRIKLLRNKREVQLKQMRREIAQLLQNGQEPTARIRVEHIVREQNILAAYEIIELFCELVAVRLPIIESQRECPLDLREAIASLCFAAPRCSDLPELQQVQQMFAAKYGREFIIAASELRPDCGVNRQIIEKLSVRAPSAEVKLNLLKEIAEEHEVEWDPSNAANEFFKLHEDLLDGPTHFTSSSKTPLPDEKDQSHFSVKHSNKVSNSDMDSDGFDLPEVPKPTVVQSSDAELAGGTLPPAVSSCAQSESEGNFNSGDDNSVLHLSPIGADVPFVNIESPVGSPKSPPNRFDSTYNEKQFVPFISEPPPLRSPVRSPEKTMRNTVSVSRTKSKGSMDFQDVLTAAQAAAESADRAAAAARAAADLAKVKISELSAQAGSGSFGSDDEGPILEDDSKEVFPSGKQTMSDSNLPQDTQPEQLLKTGERQSDIFDLNLERVKSMEESQPPGHPDRNMTLSPKTLGIPVYDSPNQVPFPLEKTALDDQSTHQPHRWNSMEDDYYYSYPSIFSSQNSFSQQGESQPLDNATSNTQSTTYDDHQHGFHY